MVLFRFVSTVTWYVAFCYFFQRPETEISSLTVLKGHAGSGPIHRRKRILDSCWQKFDVIISVFPVMCRRVFSGFDPLDSC